jgi:DNA invertase Pin-like site-specific DNA recombinase
MAWFESIPGFELLELREQVAEFSLSSSSRSNGQGRRCLAEGHRAADRRHHSGAGKSFLDMLGVFAEFETNLRRERQLEGIAKAKAAGVYKGRPASIDMIKVRGMKAEGMGASEIAKAVRIGRASIYRAF